MSNSLDEEDVWAPCEGRSTSGGHNEYGFCQAGASASLNEVTDPFLGSIIIIIIIIIKNECHSNIIVDRLQGCGHSKKLRESESESRSSKVV